MSITGLPGQGPVRVGIAINDTSAGILLANGIVLALLERERSGAGPMGAHLLIEAQLFMLDFQASRWLMKGEVAGQEGNFHPTSPGTGMFQTADGYINIAASATICGSVFARSPATRNSPATPISRPCRCAPERPGIDRPTSTTSYARSPAPIGSRP